MKPKTMVTEVMGDEIESPFFESYAECADWVCTKFPITVDNCIDLCVAIFNFSQQSIEQSSKIYDCLIQMGYLASLGFPPHTTMGKIAATYQGDIYSNSLVSLQHIMDCAESMQSAKTIYKLIYHSVDDFGILYVKEIDYELEEDAVSKVQSLAQSPGIREASITNMHTGEHATWDLSING